MELMSTIISILTSGLVSFASNVGGALTSFAEGIFMTSGTDGQTLSTFGTLIIIFAGISLCFGLMRWVLNFITSLGARNR